MSQEILYTSAPEGLKPGSRGFCTVVSTAGMAKNLAERLEALSGYRHVYLPHESNAHLNPVNFSHVILTVGGTRYHVLSRIADAGLDYSQRSNKLAHHVTLEDRECRAAPGGPAWVLSQDGFCESAWDGTTRILQVGRAPRNADCPVGVCRAWERLAGDPGWAGVLAETAAQAERRPMPVIFRLGTDVLPLVIEALALLPPEKRWDVCFSTYFTRLPAGAECHWRFLLDGTSEAKAIQKNPHAVSIDLTRPLGTPRPGNLVEAARTGVVPLMTPLQPETAVPRRSKTATFRAPSTMDEIRPIEQHEVQVPVADGLPLKPPPVAPAAWLEPVSGSGFTPRSGELFARSRRHRLPIYVMAAVLLIMLPVAMMTGYYFGARSVAEAKITNDQEGPAEVAPPPTPFSDDQPGEDSENNTTKPLEQDTEPEEQQNTDLGEHTDELVTSTELPPPSEATEENATEPPREQHTDEQPEEQPASLDPLADIRKRNNILELPPRKTVLAGQSIAQLAKIEVLDPADVQLTLHPGDLRWKKHRGPLQLDFEAGAGTVFVEEKTSLGSVLKKKIATFTLESQSLMFAWETDPPLPEADSLPLHFLFVQAGEYEERCVLTSPTIVEPIRLSMKHTTTKHDVPISPAVFAVADQLRVDYWVGDQFPKHELKDAVGVDLKSASKRLIEFPDRTDHGEENQFAQIAIKSRILDKDNQHVQPRIEVTLERFCFPRRVDGAKWEDLSRSIVEDLSRECDIWIKSLGADERVLEDQLSDIDEEIAKLVKDIQAVDANVLAFKAQNPEPPAPPDGERESVARRLWTNTLANLQAPKKKLIDNMQTAQDRRTELEARKGQVESRTRFSESNKAWCERMVGLLDELESEDGSLHYRLYVETDDGPIEILRTSDAPATADFSGLDDREL